MFHDVRFVLHPLANLVLGIFGDQPREVWAMPMRQNGIDDSKPRPLHVTSMGNAVVLLYVVLLL